MTPGARLAAAIDILDEISGLRRPAALVLKEWGAKHRFAGSGDRAAISAIVYDTLRVRASAAWIMGEESGRALVLGAMKLVRGMDSAALGKLCSGQAHAPDQLDQIEIEKLENASLTQAPAHVQANVPEWLAKYLVRAFGDKFADEMEALRHRAPVDLRVNTLLSSRQKVRAALQHLNAENTPLSPWGLRIAPGKDGRGPALAAEPAFARGRIEIQDEASQLAALLSGAQGGWQVLDLCAGAGGKTLALAAMMNNRGQVYATDSDGRRLMPLYKRLEKSGARNVQVRAPRGAHDILADLDERCHLVFADAPCTGSGTWRRNPDAKWRIRPGALEQRMREQDEVLEAAVRFVRPGGRIVYVTCSFLREENEDRISAFLENHSEFAPVEVSALAQSSGVPEIGRYSSPHGPGIRLSPVSSGADGFYIAVLSRVA